MNTLDWLRGYRQEWLRPDLIAGLVAAAVVIPKAMAYATVAGLPVQAGLYTALVPAVIYAVLGSSRVLSVSTTTTIAILTGADLALVVPDGDPAMLLVASATLAVMVGALLTLASVLRLGFLATFISEPVLSGFKAGIGVVIVLEAVRARLLLREARRARLLDDVARVAEHVRVRLRDRNPDRLGLRALRAALRLRGRERERDVVPILARALPDLRAVRELDLRQIAVRAQVVAQRSPAAARANPRGRHRAGRTRTSCSRRR